MLSEILTLEAMPDKTFRMGVSTPNGLLYIYLSIKEIQDLDGWQVVALRSAIQKGYYEEEELR